VVLCETIPVLLNDGISDSDFRRHDSQSLTELRARTGKEIQNVVLTSTFVLVSQSKQNNYEDPIHMHKNYLPYTVGALYSEQMTQLVTGAYKKMNQQHISHVIVRP
jgi:hypothetical protein